MGGMCAKINNIYAWREQTMIEWSQHVISIVGYCHSAKLCALAARAFWSQQSGAVTRIGTKKGDSSIRWLSLSAWSQDSLPQKWSPVQDFRTERCILFTALHTATCILFLASTPINWLCDLFAQCWVIADCHAQLLHHLWRCRWFIMRVICY